MSQVLDLREHQRMRAMEKVHLLLRGNSLLAAGFRHRLVLSRAHFRADVEDMSAIADRRHDLQPDDLRNTTTTVVFVDVVEYVRLVERDEASAVRRIRLLLADGAHPIVTRHGGRVVHQMGDGLLLTFADSREAVRCANALHRLADEHSRGLSDEDRLSLRIGIHSTDVLTDDITVMGHGVNLTARLMALAGPAQTIVSSSIRDLLTNGLDGDIEDIGTCYVKHVAEPVHAYRINALDREALHVAPPVAAASLLPRIAVLPFEEYGTDASAGGSERALGVGDIVTDQLIAHLSRSPLMSVISRLSCHALRGRDLPFDEVRRRLGADYVLSGRYIRSGDKLTILVELVQTDNQQVLWADSIGGHVADALASDSDLVLSIARPATATVVRSEMVAARVGSLPNVSSHAMYLFAISVLHRFSRSEFERAKAMLETLRERAPRHPASLAWLARWYMLRTVQGWSDDPAGDGKKAWSWANRALDIDPESSLALTMAGAARRTIGRDLDGAQHYFDRALEHNPNEPLAWLFKGTIHGLRGESDQALASSERALALSPLDPMRSYFESLSATAATGAGQHERAIELARSAVRGNINHGSSYRTMAISQSMLGRVDEARVTVARLLEVEPESTVEKFVIRSGGASPMVLRYAEALEAAGLPK